VWIKNRSTGTGGDHILHDALRGNFSLSSNLTNAEIDQSANWNGFSASWFSVKGSTAQYNNTGNNYVGWQWKEGATQGFDIVTYTGNGTNNRAISHSLGVTPAFIIVKDRTNTFNWDIYHQSLGINATLIFTTAATRNVSAFGTSAPTSTVFYTQNSYTNTNSANLVAYLFSEVAGFSRFGSYTGNGSADGPFVFCGFRPRWVMIKRTDTSGFSWCLHDTARDPENPNDLLLYAEASSAEAAANFVDMLSNGFKVRNLGGGWNASGGTYVYAAFSEHPFKNALAR